MNKLTLLTLLYTIFYSVSCGCIINQWVLEATIGITVNYPITIQPQSDECTFQLQKSNNNSSIDITGYGLNIYMSENVPDDRKLVGAALSVYNDTFLILLYSSYSDSKVLYNINNNANYTIKITCLNNTYCGSNDNSEKNNIFYMNTVIDIIGSCVSCVNITLRPELYDNFSPRIAKVSSFKYSNYNENGNVLLSNINNADSDSLNINESCKKVPDDSPIFLCYKIKI
ncbi:NFkB inhibitor [NY_014 poxvirus]|uniref:NFkB inhibitor n=1 Tax=NY_014 poxvirus TaxID=2025360 RepID=UPI000B99F9FF|nr:NFkB inhibitor [NY_014 poxvirus]AST09590.1 NFkB inhibitor [NY_014 poxvirus]